MILSKLLSRSGQILQHRLLLQNNKDCWRCGLDSVQNPTPTRRIHFYRRTILPANILSTHQLLEAPVCPVISQGFESLVGISR